LELAINLALDRGAVDVLILGGLGGRWDHTLANLMLLTLPRIDKVNLRLVDGLQEASLLCTGQWNRINGKTGDIVSLIPIGGDVHGVTTYGLEYPLRDDQLLLGETLGVSNLINAPEARVTLREGLLICLVIHKSC
jgi:thiamine pyrophosphokinase